MKKSQLREHCRDRFCRILGTGFYQLALFLNGFVPCIYFSVFVNGLVEREGSVRVPQVVDFVDDVTDVFALVR